MAQNHPEASYWLSCPETLRFDLLVFGLQRTTPDNCVSAIAASYDGADLAHIAKELAELVTHMSQTEQNPAND